MQRWLEHVSIVDFLLLDDIFKVRLTDSFEGFLFSIVCQRTEACLPIVITTNDDGASLMERLTLDRGEPLLRRIKESCGVVPFCR